MNPLVSGHILFAQKPRLSSTAKIYVQLLDTSMADVPARRVAEQVLTDIAQKANAGQPIPFEIYGGLPDQRASYSIAVLVDVDGDGKISKGDYINMQNYSVLTFGHPNHVTVIAKEVP